MARRLGDQRGLAILLARALNSARATSTLDEILAMLTEARDLGDELGDVEHPSGRDGLAGGRMDGAG